MCAALLLFLAKEDCISAMIVLGSLCPAQQKMKKLAGNGAMDSEASVASAQDWRQGSVWVCPNSACSCEGCRTSPLPLLLSFNKTHRPASTKTEHRPVHVCVARKLQEPLAMLFALPNTMTHKGSMTCSTVFSTKMASYSPNVKVPRCCVRL